MKNFETLEEEEQKRLLKYPAYIALLAVNKDARIDEDEKSAAEKFLHIKTYSCNSLFRDFYAKADEQFEKTLSELDKELPSERGLRELAIRKELAGLGDILKKLEPDYARLLHDSMRSFKEHVSKAHFNVLEYFIFPLPVKDITD